MITKLQPAYKCKTISINTDTVYATAEDEMPIIGDSNSLEMDCHRAVDALAKKTGYRVEQLILTRVNIYLHRVEITGSIGKDSQMYWQLVYELA